MAKIVFITGSNTGVGKTVVTVLLTKWLISKSVNVRTLKPACSGGLDDAVAVAAAQGGGLPLGEITPWFFRDPLAPLLAARNEGQVVRVNQVLSFIRRHAKLCDLVLVEGAGGLLSPMMEDGDALDLICELEARPVVVCANQLGAINQSLLVWRALPAERAAAGRLALISQQTPDLSAEGNVAYLKERLGASTVVSVPWIAGGADTLLSGSLPPALGSVADAIIG